MTFSNLLMPYTLQFGFKPLAEPDRFMEKHNPDVYAKRTRG